MYPRLETMGVRYVRMMIQLTLSFKSQGKWKSFIYRKQSNANQNQSNANRIQSNANRNQSNQLRKTLENSIDSITVRLIRSIENQLNSIDFDQFDC